MAPEILIMLVVVVLALALGATVLAGYTGVLADRAPVLNDRLATIARHLNGDADAPEGLTR